MATPVFPHANKINIPAKIIPKFNITNKFIMKKKKRAFITGISGQDGAYLASFLLSKDYIVYGGDRRTASGSLWRLKKLGVENKVKIMRKTKVIL